MCAPFYNRDTAVLRMNRLNSCLKVMIISSFFREEELFGEMILSRYSERVKVFFCWLVDAVVRGALTEHAWYLACWKVSIRKGVSNNSQNTRGASERCEDSRHQTERTGQDVAQIFTKGEDNSLPGRLPKDVRQRRRSCRKICHVLIGLCMRQRSHVSLTGLGCGP